jgi:hypothetical protein
MQSILEKLKGGDRRSLGKAHEVAAEVQGILYPDPVVRMRAADAVEKITVQS